ncbi:MAG: hypothetical protein JNL05_15945 [Flavobacteriales bacterium]|nr:hypothetical protein [Flavobacteriales bacterium]
MTALPLLPGLQALLVAALLQAAGAIRCDAQYTTDWVATFDNLSGFHSGEDLQVDSAGNVFVNGFFTPSNTLEHFIAGFDANGTEQWRNGLPDSIGRAWKLFRLPDGTLLSCGDFENSSGTNDIIAMRFSSTGALLGSVVWNSPGFATGDSFSDADMDAAGNVYLAGSVTVNFQPRPGLLKVEPDGDLAWSTSLPLPANWGAFGLAIGVECLSDTLITLWCRNGTGACGLVAFDSSGTHLWTTDLAMSSEDNNHALATDGLGNAFVGGNRAQQFNVTKLDGNGTVAWSQDLSYPGLTSASSRITHVQCDAAGNTYAIGQGQYQLSIPGPYLLLAKLSPSGAVLWTDTAMGATFTACLNMDFARLDGDRWLIHTGSATSVLYAYDTAGTRLYKQPWQVPGSSRTDVNAMVTDDQGHLFLAGRAYVIGSNADGFIARLSPLSTVIDDGPRSTTSAAPYPVPATDELIIPACTEHDTVVVLDVNGREVMRTTTSGRLDIRGLPPGSYVLRSVRTGARSRFVKR